MKVLHVFQTLEEAHLAVSFLENQDIQAFVWDENVSGLYPLFNASIGMVRVAVDEEQFGLAATALQDYLSFLAVEEKEEG